MCLVKLFIFLCIAKLFTLMCIVTLIIAVSSDDLGISFLKIAIMPKHVGANKQTEYAYCIIRICSFCQSLNISY